MIRFHHDTLKSIPNKYSFVQGRLQVTFSAKFMGIQPALLSNNNGSGVCNSTHRAGLTKRIYFQAVKLLNSGTSSRTVCQYPVSLYFPKAHTI